jgi:lipopolysaccharide export system protein LptA
MRIMDISISYLHTKNLAFWLSLSLAYTTTAQQPESSEAIYVTSDSSVFRGLFNDGERVVTHSGNVRITQGLVEITG